MLLARNYGSDLLIKNSKTNLRKYILITVTWYIFITAAFYSNRLRFNTMVNVFWVLAIIIYVVNIKIPSSFFIFQSVLSRDLTLQITRYRKVLSKPITPRAISKFFDDKSAIRMNTSYTVPIKFSILGSSKHQHKNRFHCI